METGAGCPLPAAWGVYNPAQWRTPCQRCFYSGRRVSGRAFSWRREADAFRILLAEVLLQRSRSSTVERVFEQLTLRWSNASALAAADVEEIAEVIRPLGLTSRAPRIKQLALVIANQGRVPTNPRELRELPGVGYYVAGATAAALGKEEYPLVDSVSVGSSVDTSRTLPNALTWT